MTEGLKERRERELDKNTEFLKISSHINISIDINTQTGLC